MLFYFIENLALELGYGFPFSRPRYPYLNFFHVLGQVIYLTMTEKRKQSKTVKKIIGFIYYLRFLLRYKLYLQICK